MWVELGMSDMNWSGGYGWGWQVWMRVGDIAYVLEWGAPYHFPTSAAFYRIPPENCFE